MRRQIEEQFEITISIVTLNAEKNKVIKKLFFFLVAVFGFS